MAASEWTWPILLSFRGPYEHLLDRVSLLCLPSSANLEMTTQTSGFVTPQIYMDLKESTFCWCLVVSSYHD